MKTIYILRHSIPDKTKYKKTPNELEKNKSIEIKEIKKAKEFFEKQEYKNIKNIYTSDYKRTIQTGKILNENIKIDKRLGERIAGTPNYEITPQEYFYKQIKDENYKFKNGESRKEIEERMYEAIIEILNKNDQAIIITHGASLTFLLMKFCNVEITNIQNKIRKITFKNKKIFENKINYLETFKLIFNEKNELIEIKSIGGLNENI